MPACTLYIVQCTGMYSVHYTIYTVHCIMYTIHCTMYSIQCTLHYTHYTLYIVHMLYYKYIYITSTTCIICTMYNIWTWTYYSGGGSWVSWGLPRMSGFENEAKNNLRRNWLEQLRYLQECRGFIDVNIVYCTMYTVQYTVYNVHCTLYNVYCVPRM